MEEVDLVFIVSHQALISKSNLSSAPSLPTKNFPADVSAQII